MYRNAILFATYSIAMIIAVGQTPMAHGQPAAKEPTAKFMVGPWQYEFALKAWGTRSEGEWGTLSHDGQRLDAATMPTLEINDYVHTPWGTLYWGGMSKFIWGAHGWFPTPAKGKMVGKRITPPNAPANECVLGEADHGTKVLLPQGTRIRVLLPANRPWERAWKLGDLDGDVLRPLGQPLDRRSPLPLGWGNGAWLQYAFQAERPGVTILSFDHQTDSQGAAPSMRKVRITVHVVQADNSPMPGKTAEVDLSSTVPHAKVTLSPAGSLKIHISVAGGTGYKPHLIDPPAGTANLVGSPTVDGPKSAKLGAPSLHHFEFRIASSPPKEFRLVFRLLRPGETTRPEYDVAVTVIEASKN